MNDKPQVKAPNYRKALTPELKVITDAPGLRAAGARCCCGCQFWQAIEGDYENGACTRFEFQPEYDMVCDAWEAVPPPDPVPVEVVADMTNVADAMDAADKTFVTFGGSVKALGNGRIGGYLIRFGDETKTDLEGDFFTRDTQYGSHSTSQVFYQHGLDDVLKRRVLADGAPLKTDDIGVWIEAQLQLRDAYEQFIYGQVEAGKMGWSSGTASHLVEREPRGKAMWIKAWPLGLDASITPTPAEPRNSVVPLKSFKVASTAFKPGAQSPGAGQPAAGAAANSAGEQSNKHQQEAIMPEELKAITDALASITATLGAVQTEQKAIRDALANEPAGTDGVSVTVDEADRPFKSLANYMVALKQMRSSNGNNTHPRLKALEAMKATGASEGVGSDGGFLLEPTLTADVLAPMHETAAFTSGVRNLPVGPNSNSGVINGVDETSRATGSRWGGVRGYRLAEGDAFTASRPKLRQIAWKLKKYGALVYATDELLADATQYAAIVRQGVGEELSFMANDDVLNGVGNAGCLGILNAGCLVSVSKESGQAAATIVTQNLSKMWQRLDPKSKANAVWFINSECAPQLDQLFIAAGVGGLEPRMVTYGSDGAIRIKGRPVVETEYNAALGTVGDIVLADLSQYLFWEKGGVQEAQSIHVQFTTDETVMRFIYRCDGQPALASALTPYKGSNTQSPFVALATRA